MKRLIYIAVIVAMLAIMMMPPMTDSYVASSYIYDYEHFYYGSYGSDLFISGSIYAYEQPYRQVVLKVRIYTGGIYRIFPAVELYSEPEPGPYEPETDVLGKYYFDEDIIAWPVKYYQITLRQDEASPAVFGRVLFGLWAEADWWGTVYNIEFHDNGTAPDIIWDEDLSSALAVQMWQWEGEDPFGFY